MNDEKQKLERVLVALKTGEVQIVEKVSRWYIESDEDDVPRVLMLWLRSGECMMINFDCLMYVSTVDFVKKGGWENRAGDLPNHAERSECVCRDEP